MSLVFVFAVRIVAFRFVVVVEVLVDVLAVVLGVVVVVVVVVVVDGFVVDVVVEVEVIACLEGGEGDGGSGTAAVTHRNGWLACDSSLCVPLLVTCTITGLQNNH